MTIHELLQAAGLTANDEIPIWDVDGTGEPTKKITAQQLAAAVVALANLVTGVKGNAESSYRTGNVNITPANIGAKAVQSAVSDPTASGTAVAFIDSISQNAQGVISPTKKTVQSASQSAAGLMSAADKKKLDGIEAGAQVNSVTGVKGNAESSYRTGDVNLTAANLGAAPSSIIRTLDGTVNIDNVLTTGIYYLNGCSGSGLPSTSNAFYGMLICMSNNEYNPGGRVVQIFAYPFANANNNHLMMRTYMTEYGWSNWTTILNGNNVAPIESGGTGVSSLAALKNILGLNANMGIQFQELSGSNQVFGLRFECKNQNNTALYGHALTFYLTNTGLALWDITDQRNIWSK